MHVHLTAMNLHDRIQDSRWRWVLVIGLVLFFVDDVLLALFGAFLIGGLAAVALVLAVGVFVFWRTEWGRKKRRAVMELI